MGEEVLYGLPKEVKFCKRCVISNQRPSSSVEFKSTLKTGKETIAFDDEGICSACRYADIKEKQINWQQREAQLIELCKAFRSKTGQYDCIVPCSGGKDSSFAAHILKHKYGMHPLTVTWAPHMYLDVGFANLQSLIHSGVDNILFTPNGKFHRYLSKQAFLNLCHPFQPFIVGQKHIGPKFSSMYGVPLVFYGENQAEYGNNIKDTSNSTMNTSFFMDDVDLTKIFLGGVSAQDLLDIHNATLDDLHPYLPADKNRLKATGTVVHYLGHYLKWDPQEMYYYAVENTGFKAASERSSGTYSKYTEIDDLLVPFHFYTMFVKFGIGRATYDAAQEIRNKKITREEGVALVKKYDAEFPQKYFKTFLDYIDLKEEEFFKRVDQARSSHLWEKQGNEWVLKHAVWKECLENVK